MSRITEIIPDGPWVGVIIVILIGMLVLGTVVEGIGSKMTRRLQYLVWVLMAPLLVVGGLLIISQLQGLTS